MLRKPWPIEKGLAALGSLDVVGASVGEVTVDRWAVCQLVVSSTSVYLGVCELSFEQSAALLLFLLNVLKYGHWDCLHSAPVPVAWLGSICNVAIATSNVILVYPIRGLRGKKC